MVPPPDPLRVTVQVVAAPEVNVPGLHVMELIAVTPVMVTPVAVTATASPDAEAPILLLIVIGTSPLPDWVSDRVATNPSEMVLEFKPQATH
jgi:hypothetical protein